MAARRTPLIIDAAVLEETFVFGRQNGLLHDVGDFGKATTARRFAEFADQVTVGGIDPEGILGR